MSTRCVRCPPIIMRRVHGLGGKGGSFVGRGTSAAMCSLSSGVASSSRGATRAPPKASSLAKRDKAASSHRGTVRFVIQPRRVLEGPSGNPPCFIMTGTTDRRILGFVLAQARLEGVQGGSPYGCPTRGSTFANVSAVGHCPTSFAHASRGSRLRLCRWAHRMSPCCAAAA